MKKIIATKNGSVKANLAGVVSGTLLGKIKQNGGIFVGGEKVKVSTQIKEGEEIILEFPKRKGEVSPYFCDVAIAFEDEDIIILEKPSGMPTHTSRGNCETTLENAYCGILKGRGEDVSRFVFHPITRLDKDTSGLCLVAKNPISADFLSLFMKEGKIKKTYFAVCEGKVEKEFFVNLPIARICEGEILRGVCENGKQSETHFVREWQEGGKSGVWCYPKTGRTHQIRVHLASQNHPICGDKLYGKCENGERLMLHMAVLEFFDMNNNAKKVVSQISL